MHPIMIDDLEIDYGTAILSELTGQHLTRNRQPVRLFDQTRHSSEYFFRSDRQGKPYVQNFAEGKRYYPVTAYCQTYGIDYKTAKDELCRQYGLANGFTSTVTDRPRPVRPVVTGPPPVDYLPVEVYRQSRNQFERNGLYLYLRELFDPETAANLFEQYRLGTSRHWKFKETLATCLPQFDTAGNLRQVKVIPFHPVSGRRAKPCDPAEVWDRQNQKYRLDEAEKVWFAGRSLSSVKNPNLQQCYFGEHLLAEHPTKTVALVEGESTAIVCSAIWPDYLWLATGGSTGGKWYAPDRFEVLRGRKVVLWPDSGKYEDWQEKAQPIRAIAATLRVSRYVEQNAPAGAGNLDLRDLLTHYDDIPADNQPPAYPADWDEVATITAPSLVISPNQSLFARLLELDPASLPLYRLVRY